MAYHGTLADDIWHFSLKRHSERRQECLVRITGETAAWYRVKNLWLWWCLMAFLTTVADPSLAFRMTSYRTLSFRTGARMLCEDNRETAAWHGVKNLLLWWRLMAFFTTAVDPSLAFRMTSYRTLSFRTEARMPCEDNRETAAWYRVKNLWLWWRITVSATFISRRKSCQFTDNRSRQSVGRKGNFIVIFCIIPTSKYSPPGFASHLFINKRACPFFYSYH